MSIVERIADHAVEGAVAAVERNMGGIIEKVMDATWSHPWYPFIVGGQCILIERGMKPAEAWKLARKVLIEYVRSEKVEYGDPDYDWGPQGGRTVVLECEIEHWESVA